MIQKEVSKSNKYEYRESHFIAAIKAYVISNAKVQQAIVFCLLKEIKLQFSNLCLHG